jgi:hypothetical protein
MNVVNPIDRAMLARIKAREHGWVFSPSDFLGLGSRDAVDKALSRLAAGERIRRVARGLYDVPRQHPIVGVAAPKVDQVAKALAGKAGTRLQATGAYAANLLGLSDQVPAKVVFLTDGRSKRVRIDKLEIVLKQTSPRNMGTAGRISGLVIQALRYLGKAHVDDGTVKRLGSRLTPGQKAQLLQDLAYAPAWVGKVIRRVADRT